ncbi:MAG: hypothetical protein Q8O84_05440 [Nanoarchaeota archaeon]|nr:hypothetical protein [Nanoarchaeota archaeon]
MINAYGILIGIFANSVKNKFSYDYEDYTAFFFKKSEEYSILRGIHDFREAMTILKMAEVIKLCPGLCKKGYTNGICKSTYENFVKPALNEMEISELEKLSKEFSIEF